MSDPLQQSICLKRLGGKKWAEAQFLEVTRDMGWWASIFKAGGNYISSELLLYSQALSSLTAFILQPLWSCLQPELRGAVVTGRQGAAELLTWDRRSRQGPAQHSPAGRGNQAVGSSGTETARTSAKDTARESCCCQESLPCLPVPSTPLIHPPGPSCSLLSPNKVGSTAFCRGDS